MEEKKSFHDDLNMLMLVAEKVVKLMRFKIRLSSPAPVVYSGSSLAHAARARQSLIRFA